MPFICDKCNFSTNSAVEYKRHLAEGNHNNLDPKLGIKNGIIGDTCNRKGLIISNGNNANSDKLKYEVNMPITLVEEASNLKQYSKVSNNNMLYRDFDLNKIEQNFSGSASSTPKPIHQNHKTDNETNNCNNLDMLTSVQKKQMCSITQSISSWSCNLCNVMCNSKEKYQEHVKGQKHMTRQAALYRYDPMTDIANNSSNNLISCKPSIEEQPTIEEPLVKVEDVKDNIFSPVFVTYKPTDADLNTWNRNQLYISQISAGSIVAYRCKLCNITCNSSEVLLAHFNGKNHLKNVNKLAIINGSSSSTFSNLQPVQKCFEGTDNRALNLTSNGTNNCNILLNKTQLTSVSNSNLLAKHTSVELKRLLDEGVMEHAQVGTQNGFICKACNLFCNSSDSAVDHINGRKHMRSYASHISKKSINRLPTLSLSDPTTIEVDEYELKFDQTRAVQILDYYWTQTFGMNSSPKYIEDSFGPAHEKEFKITVDLSDLGLNSEPGFGKSKRDAKRNACINACSKLDKLGLLRKAVPDYLYFQTN